MEDLTGHFMGMTWKWCRSLLPTCHWLELRHASLPAKGYELKSSGTLRRENLELDEHSATWTLSKMFQMYMSRN